MKLRRESLLEIGELFTDKDKLRAAAGKDVIKDMAIVLYAVECNKVHMLEGILNTEELSYDIKHTDNHFYLKQKQNEMKETT